jgi:Ner family transcriptional regulator
LREALLSNVDQKKAGGEAPASTGGNPMTQRPKPAMDWPGVIAELHRQGMTLTELGIRNGINPNTIRRLKSVKHYPSQKVVAEFLGVEPETIWPDRYPKGKPRILDIKKFPRVASQIDGSPADKKDVA